MHATTTVQLAEAPSVTTADTLFEHVLTQPAKCMNHQRECGRRSWLASLHTYDSGKPTQLCLLKSLRLTAPFFD